MLTVVNVEVLNKQTGGKFELPLLVERQTLYPGDYAKAIFEAAPGRAAGERMWLRVVLRFPSGRYIGELRNTPVAVADVNLGDFVEFGPENVCQVLREEELETVLKRA